MRLGAIVVLSMSAGIASGQNVTFSFASDVSTEVPQFRGGANDGTISSVRIPTRLLVDDANGPLPTLEYNERFYSGFTLTHKDSTMLPSGQYVHTYGIDGGFSIDALSVMHVNIENGILTALGDENSWGSTATIQASSSAGSTVTYGWEAADEPDYNLYRFQTTSELTDAAFTLTNIMSFPDVGIPINGANLNPQTMLPEIEWQSEGSYSGSAFFVPAPGSIAAMSIVGVGLTRRKR